MASIQLGIHCLDWNVDVTRSNLLPTGHAIRCPKLLLMACEAKPPTIMRRSPGGGMSLTFVA